VKASSSYRNPIELPAHGRVASKFVNCARDYLGDLDLPVQIVPLYGSVELGPITGMSEAIIDLVSTGRTLKENGLIEIATLFESSARLVAHPLSYHLGSNDITAIVEGLRAATLQAVQPDDDQTFDNLAINPSLDFV
jgi:ATP phosphoribosyltransferase